MTQQTVGSRWSEFISREINPNRLVPGITLGLVMGMVEIIVAISFAALIFSGSLTPYLSTGIGLALFGTALAGLIIALMSSLPGVVAGNQDVPAAVMAILAASIAAGMPAGASADETLLTVLAAIALATVLTGAFFLVMGAFRFGGLARFLPYPVVGGFLAGTGWLLVTGAVGMMANETGAPQISNLVQPETLALWLPGLLLASVLLITLRRFEHFLILPGVLILAILLFYLVTWIGGLGIDELHSGGWLLGPFSDQGLWRPLTPGDLALVEWPVIFKQAASFATVLLVSLVALLLNTSALELSAQQDVNLNKELRAAGVGTLLAGLATGLVNYQQLSLSALNVRLASGSRAASVIVAGLCLVALGFGASSLALFPKVVLGGLLLFLGLDFLVEWVIASWFRLPRIDSFVILMILAVTAVVGFLEAVAVGLIVAIVMFVVSYSRVTVIKHELDGVIFHSRVTRRPDHQEILDREGDRILILELQGFIFFGTADRLLDQVRQRVADPNLNHLRYAVLDFRRVTGLDSTAMLSFNRMVQVAAAYEVTLVLTSLRTEIGLLFRRGGFAEGDGSIRMFPSLDQGVAWCEDQLLEQAGSPKGAKLPHLSEQLQRLMPQEDDWADLLAYLVKVELEPGQYLMRQGEPPDDMYFIEDGMVTAQLENKGRPPILLETMEGGRVVGELGFYLNRPRTAAVVAVAPSIVYRLSAQRLQEMERDSPEMASKLHRLIIHLLSERVTHLISAVDALEE